MKDQIIKKMATTVVSGEPPKPSVTPSMAPMAHHAMAGNDHSLISSIVFKPAMEAPEDSNYAFCQVKSYLPKNFTATHDSTVLVSIDHHIKPTAAFESMKKYAAHRMEIARGIPMGDMELSLIHI